VVADADIEVAERYLGVSFDEPRREILRSNDTFDVQACPGSGKTTLLVAKLAILGARWPHARRGICVLSHTNVARQEIESKLAGTAVGHRLLAYPHFVGTIHGFVNAFLALPLLRSEGYHVRLIDDESHGDICRRLLYSVDAYAKARLYLENKEQHSPDRTIRALRYEGSDLTLGSAAGSLPCSAESPSGKILDRIKREAVSKGFWRFDDMFAWAERAAGEAREGRRVRALALPCGLPGRGARHVGASRNPAQQNLPGLRLRPPSAVRGLEPGHLRFRSAGGDHRPVPGKRLLVTAEQPALRNQHCGQSALAGSRPAFPFTGR